jgi:hypothetical protein
VIIHHNNPDFGAHRLAFSLIGIRNQILVPAPGVLMI